MKTLNLSEIKFAKSLEQAISYAKNNANQYGYDKTTCNCQCGENSAIDIFGYDYQYLETVVICEACYEQYEDNRVF